MSDNPGEPTPPPQIKSSLASPQVLAAIITALAALIVALVPLLTNNATTAPIPTPTVAPTSMPTSTPVSPTDIPTAALMPPTDIPTVILVLPTTANLPLATVTAFPLPTEITLMPSEPDTSQAEVGSANVLLMYDDVSFTIYNQDDRTLSISDIRFSSSSGRWDGEAWGPSLARSFPADNCLRLRNAASGQRQPPAICGSNLYGLQLVGPQALFWLNVDAFEVAHNGEVIATCRADAGSCEVSVP